MIPSAALQPPTKSGTPSVREQVDPETALLQLFVMPVSSSARSNWIDNY
jgi:hypothetical protein